MSSRQRWTLVAVCMGTFMLLLDITVVNVALPDIRKSLNASFTDLQWVVDAYALTLATLLLTAGSLADKLGRRRMFVAGMGIFVVASLLCGLSGTPTVLNLSRALQGVGGAIMFATSLALLVFGLIRANDYGWGSTTIVLRFVGAVVLFAAFVITERRVRDPMFDLSLFRKPAFDGVSIAAFALSAAMFAMFLYITLYMQ